jgi:hypothetical protein
VLARFEQKLAAPKSDVESPLAEAGDIPVLEPPADATGEEGQ